MIDVSLEHENYDASVLCPKTKKNRSSAPLKNRVGHTMLAGSAIVKLVGLIRNYERLSMLNRTPLFCWRENYDELLQIDG